jgi:site-specific DNA recombinase
MKDRSKNRYIALARVSSREQEREGFSLDVQEDGLRSYAQRNGGEIVRLFRIAETASKKDERKTFKELIAYAKAHAAELSGILFYKIDRAARNMFDYVELERLESDHDLPFISVTQPTENSPAGRMQRRILANMAAYYTEQQSIDVREGIAKRVESGLFASRPPFGYRNVRYDGRSLVEVHPENGPKVRRIFELYAFHGQTLDSLRERLADEGVTYSTSQPRFHRSKIHEILTDRAYIGKVNHRGQWHPGSHEHLIDRGTWDRVQALLGNRIYRSHGMTYASELIRCGHCGSPITGELKSKRTKAGVKHYIYYRCSQYSRGGHPRVRLRESELDEQVLGLFDRMRIEDEAVRDWFHRVLRASTVDQQRATREHSERLERQLRSLARQQDNLLNLRLNDEIEATTYNRKAEELRDQEAKLRLQLEACGRDRQEDADLAIQVFELSQCLREKWVAADQAAKRRILEILCLNFRLDDRSLIPTMRKPFDVLAEGLISNESRGERI